MSDFTVNRYGDDPFGRSILMTTFLHDWFEAYVEELGWRPRIEQGAFMSRLGGGAAASSGAHDLGGCLDLQTEGRSTAEIDRMVWVARKRGAGAYRRDRTWRHGDMPPHMHLTLGADRPLSPMAQILWGAYVAGGDGLAIQPPQPDYERRPVPLILTPPKEWSDMATKAEIEQVVKKATREVLAEALIEPPANDAEFNSGQKVSPLAALRRIWRLSKDGVK